MDLRNDFNLSREPISEEDFIHISSYINDHCGVVIPPEKAYLIETRLSKFMIDAGLSSFGEFYKYLISNADPSLSQKVIDAVTTHETFWFRDNTPWKVLEEILLPSLVDKLKRKEKEKVRIWSAAVSTGQEVYSTVMCVDNYIKKRKIQGITLDNFDFFATDISSNVLEIAKKGRYDRISMRRGLDNYYRDKYFTEKDAAWDIDPKIRDAVQFIHFNLKNNYSVFGSFDIIFCRYVLIYFSDKLKQETITKMSGALNSGGILFTGNYALYDFFNNEFDKNRCENLTYYSKKEGLK